MKLIKSMFLLFVAGLMTLSATAQLSAQTKDIVDVAAGLKDYTTLVAAVGRRIWSQH